MSNIIDYSKRTAKIVHIIYRMCPKIKAKQTLSWSMKSIQNFGVFMLQIIDM